FFGFPVAHEDDALRAVRAALEVRTAVHSLNADVSTSEGVRHRLRAGIETGDIVVAGPGATVRHAVRGPVVSAAHELEHAAADDEILAGPAVQRLLRGAVILKQAGGAGGAMAWHVLEAVAGAPAIPRAMEAPMIGRHAELTRLRSAFRRAARSDEVVDRLEREARGFIFVICLTRPDLLEDRSFGDVVRLEPLSASEVARLVIDRGGPAAQGPLQSIVNRAQGNPLFAEQLLAAIDDGDIDAIPPSLVGLLSMRLDRLGPGERDVLRCASVGGL